MPKVLVVPSVKVTVTGDDGQEKTMFKCTVCQEMFTDSLECKAHFTDNHIKSFQCSICKKLFSSLKGVQEHRKSHDIGATPDDISLETEGVCDSKIPDNDASKDDANKETEKLEHSDDNAPIESDMGLRKKVFKVIKKPPGKRGRGRPRGRRSVYDHETHLHECSECGRNFSTTTGFNRHRCLGQITEGKDMLVDDILEEAGEEGVAMEEVIEGVGSDSEALHCPLCNDVIYGSFAFIDHVKSHDGKGAAVKETDTTMVQDPPAEADVQEQVLPKARYKCVQCRKDFFGVEDLEVHTTTCKGVNEGYFEDSGTQVYYFVENELNGDETRVVAPKQLELYKCHCCGEVFNIAIMFQEHLAKHIGNHKLFECMKCITDTGTKYCKVHQLKLHVKAEHGDGDIGKPFKCSLCTAVYVSADDLLRHVSIHIRLKDKSDQSDCMFLCLECNRLFFKIPFLRDHNKIHYQPIGCPRCPTRFTKPCLFKAHMLNRHHVYSNKSLQCVSCPKTFAKPESLAAHELSHTGTKQYICLICEDSFFKVSVLREHVVTHVRKPVAEDGTRKIECSVCDLNFEEDKQLEDHMIEKHTNAPKYSCTLCSSTFLALQKLEAHYSMHDLKPSFKCDECGKDFVRKDGLKNHMYIHMGKKPYSCGKCSRSFIRRHDFLVHKLTHMGEASIFKCPFDMCSKKFRKNQDLQIHIRKHTGEKPFECSICQKAFTSKKNMKWKSPSIIRHWGRSGKHQQEHEKSHIPADERAMRCNECGQGFNRRFDYDNHVKSHKPKEDRCDYKCSLCDKQYSRKDSLKDHMKRHNGNPFLCDQCGRSFIRESRLRKHMVLHDAPNDKPFICVTCSKRFWEEPSLKRHMVVHTDDYPYKCKHCNKVLSSSKAYESHQRLHTGLKPFRCTVCNLGFSTEGYLEEHGKIHADDAVFNCDVCNKIFGRMAHLKRHMLNVHGIQKGERREKRPNRKSYELEDDGSVIYQCTVCDKQMTSYRAIHKHMLKMHPTKPEDHPPPDNLEVLIDTLYSQL